MNQEAYGGQNIKGGISHKRRVKNDATAAAFVRGLL
jgi:hypothetical protein